MIRALIIAGDSRRFLIESIRLRSRLNKSGIQVEPIIKTAYLTSGMVIAEVKKVLRQTGSKDLVLISYLGHGGTFGWATNDYQLVAYTELLSVFKKASCGIHIINDCCHSAALIEKVQGEISPEKLGIIASCPSDSICYKGLITEIFNSWEQGLVYEPKPIEQVISVINSWKIEEVCLNPISYRIFRLLSVMSFGKIKPITKQVMLVDEKGEKGADDVEIRIKPQRWGMQPDHLFFPKKEEMVGP